MLPKITHLPTNWIDGMKINRHHFIDSENALIDKERDGTALFLNTYNYGLLLPEPGERSSLECNVMFSQSKNFKIIISSCRAVTSGGCRIEIVPGVTPELVSDNEIFAEISGYDERKRSSISSFFAVISVDPFNRHPSGQPIAEEYPPRYPYSVSSYRLNLIPEEAYNVSISATWHLPVARFILKNDELVRDSNYIPPSSTISANQGTKQLYNQVAESLNKIQENSTEIVKKVVSLSQNTTLALNVKKLCENNMWHISSEFFFFRTMYRNMSPVFMANTIVQLAGMINVSLNLIPEKEKEELLQYFSFWNELSPGKFEEMISSVIDAEYNHEDIYYSFVPLISFLKLWTDLLEKLKELKLIGQRNEKFDFGGRTMETQKTKEKGKFSIFD